MAPLLPKLRGHFAEFLNKGSSARLGILYLPTCVGFGTGALVIDSDFSWQFEIGYFSTHVFDTHHSLILTMCGFAYTLISLLGLTSICQLSLSSCVITSLLTTLSGTGI